MSPHYNVQQAGQLYSYDVTGDEMESGTGTPTDSSWLEQGTHVSNMEGNAVTQKRARTIETTPTHPQKVTRLAINLTAISTLCTLRIKYGSLLWTPGTPSCFFRSLELRAQRHFHTHLVCCRPPKSIQLCDVHVLAMVPYKVNLGRHYGIQHLTTQACWVGRSFTTFSGSCILTVHAHAHCT